MPNLIFFSVPSVSKHLSLLTGDIIPDVDNIELKTTDSEESEEKMDLRSDPTHSTTSSSNRRLVIRTEDSDLEENDFDSFSDLEPELVQLNRKLGGFSDTEADFLDSQSTDRKMSEVSNLDSNNSSASAAAAVLRAPPVAAAPAPVLQTETQPKKEVSSESNSVEEKRENLDQPRVQSDLNKSKKKSSVSQLIARFEATEQQKEPLRVTRSVTPEKILRDKSPKRPKSAVEIEPVENGDNKNEELPLGAEALLEEVEDLDDEMTRRNGAYTSYVLIGAANNDVETASVHSGHSRGSGGSGRVVVNVNKGVVLQDGRASNISIVSTESSELGSPNEDSLLEPVPDIPAKIRARNGQVLDPGPDMQYFVAQTQPVESQRSRGGEDHEEFDESLTNYYTNGLESSNPSSRRGRPPVIRAADRSLRRGQQMYSHEEIGEGEIMVEYEDEFRITEVGPNGEQYEIYTDEMLDEDEVYDVRYESEEGEEEYVDNADYPMCQPIQYDSEEYISEGDEFFDREEELRGYNRQIDFTLHTILEESCEDSDNSEPKSRPVEQRKSKRHSDPSEMEKYFLYGVGGHDDNEEYYTTSGSSSPDEVLEDELEGVEPTSMISERSPITDDSGSVGSESDGQPTPKMNKKKVVTNKRGSTRFSSDNGSGSESESESANSSKRSSNGSKAKRRGSASDIEMKVTQSPSTSLSPKNSPPITPLPSQIIEVQPINSEDTNQVIRKHKSRDSGFVGSMDDLLRNENGSKSDSSNERQSLEKVSEVSEPEEQQPNGKPEINRKDSFNTNWSSDEDTNIMMNRMRAFFRSFLASKMENTQTQSENKSSPQIAAFEAKLTKMMKTVPGINEQQVKEIVEYLSSEDTWSDSYDSSDYTSSDIDLEVYGINVNTISDEDIIESDFQKETALMYSKLMAKMQENEKPPIAAQVMAHISSKLVALMHQESMEDSDPPKEQQQQSGPPSRRFRPTANKSKSVEVLDENQVDVWQGASRQDIASSTHGVHLSSISSPRRGSLGQVSGSSNGQVSDLLNDDERWSWKGSFESALALPQKASEQQPATTQKVTSARFKPSMVVDPDKNYSTGSLPRLGTSSIKKPQTIETSEATLELSVPPKKPVNPTNIATNVNSGPPRSARYRPHGYRPPPARKTSPSSRKSSVDNGKYTGRNFIHFPDFL